MDFVRAITYPFEDPDWLKKLGIGVLITLAGGVLSFLLLIPLLIAAMLLAGWRFQLMKRVKNNEPLPLPDWDDYMGLLKKGFTLFIAGVIYQIPVIIFACVIALVALLPMIGGGDEDVFTAMAGITGVVSVCCGCLAALYSLAATVVYWGGLIRFIDREELNTFFQIGENIAIVRNNIGDFGMALLFVILGGVIAGAVSGTGIGSLVAGIFTSYYTGHIFGQLAARVSSGATPQPPG